MGMGILGWMRVFEGMDVGLMLRLMDLEVASLRSIHAMLCSDLSKGNGDGDVEMMMGS